MSTCVTTHACGLLLHVYVQVDVLLLRESALHAICLHVQVQVERCPVRGCFLCLRARRAAHLCVPSAFHLIGQLGAARAAHGRMLAAGVGDVCLLALGQVR